MHRKFTAFASASIFLAAACEKQASQPGADQAKAAPHAAAAHASADSGQALLPIMQKLGSEMTALTHALMTDDYAVVTQRAAAIADHTPISVADLERIRSVLGAEMAAFEASDESVHAASVRLHDAAGGRNLDLVAQRLGEVQRGCVSCHARFRERLRTNREGP